MEDDNYINIIEKRAINVFMFYSLAADETDNISNTAQLTIFICRITCKFQITEELLYLRSLHVTATGEDIFTEIKGAINNLDLS